MRNRERLKSSPAGTEDGPQGTAGPQAVSLDFSLRCKKGTFLQKWFDFRLNLRSFPYSANSECQVPFYHLSHKDSEGQKAIPSLIHNIGHPGG